MASRWNENPGAILLSDYLKTHYEEPRHTPPPVSAYPDTQPVPKPVEQPVAPPPLYDLKTIEHLDYSVCPEIPHSKAV